MKTMLQKSGILINYMKNLLIFYQTKQKFHVTILKMKVFDRLLEEEKELLDISNFSFFHKIFSNFHNTNTNFNFSLMYFVFCKCYQIGPVYNFIIW